MLKGKMKKIGIQEEVQTNIIMLDLSKAGIYAEEFCEIAEKKGLLMRPFRSWLRFDGAL